MTINGNVKFMDVNFIDTNTTFTFTSASTALASFLFDNDRTTRLNSVGSDDVTPEVWEFEFTTQNVDRLYLDNHNIKSGTIKFFDGFSFVDFSPAISLSGNSDETSYFEVASVSTDRIQLTMNTTFVVDDQKRVGQFRVFTELGIVATNPIDMDPLFSEASVTHRTGTGGNVHVAFGEKYQTTMVFDDSDAADMTLFRLIKDRLDPFYVFPGGGVDKAQEGFRLRDMFFVNYMNSFEPKIKGKLFDIGTILSIDLEEV